jgi:prepilin-type processing-associated H-X9-DG protein
MGNAAATATDANLAQKTVLWGCPAWAGYASTASANGINVLQIGYGMNDYPTFTPDYPSTSAMPPGSEVAIITDGGLSTQTGKFYRQIQWRNSAERALVADSRFWVVESDQVPNLGSYPPGIVPQSNINNVNTYSPGVQGQTLVDIYRHGDYPKVSGGVNGTFDPAGGKIGFNILYCDGHVSTSNDAKNAYLATRQRFPN